MAWYLVKHRDNFTFSVSFHHVVKLLSHFYSHLVSSIPKPF